MRTIFFLLISVACFAQQPDVSDPILHYIWPDIKLVQPQLRKVYQVLLLKDHAIYAENLPDSTWVTICYGCYVPGPVEPPPTTGVDTVDGFNFVYTGWGTNSVISDPVRTPGWYKNTISYSTAGEAKYTFNGTGVELYAEKLPSHGSGVVTVGTQSKTVSWSGTKQLPALIFKSAPLPQGQHTISIKPVTGVVLIDFIVIIR